MNNQPPDYEEVFWAMSVFLAVIAFYFAVFSLHC